MILTIALNPSIVRKINIDRFQLGETNVALSDELSIGDCGIYSAYVIKVMQGDPYVMGISGGIGGRFIKNFLDRNRIKTDFLHVDHETKTMLFIHDNINPAITSISSHNEAISNRDFINIKHKLNHHIDDTEIITISGSDNYTSSLLNEIHKMSRQQKKIVLGAEGKALQECIHQNIYGVVIDLHDLELLGLSFPDTVEKFEAIRNFQKEKHIRYIIIKGNYEIVGFSRNKICKVHYHTMDNIYPIVKSTILGGLTIGIKRNYPFELIMKLIGAIADKSNINEYPFVISRKDIDRGVKRTKIYEIYNQRNQYIVGDNANGKL